MANGGGGRGGEGKGGVGRFVARVDVGGVGTCGRVWVCAGVGGAWGAASP